MPFAGEVCFGAVDGFADAEAGLAAASGLPGLDEDFALAAESTVQTKLARSDGGCRCMLEMLIGS